eukprot:352444-Chlamydomonas_euryale.AAC.2
MKAVQFTLPKASQTQMRSHGCGSQTCSQLQLCQASSLMCPPCAPTPPEDHMLPNAPASCAMMPNAPFTCTMVRTRRMRHDA